MPDELSSQVSDGIRMPYWRAAAGAEPGLLPVGDETYSYLRGLVADIAENSLVARRLVQVEYMDDPVPVGPVTVQETITPEVEGGPAFTVYQAVVGVSISCDFALSVPELAALERGRTKPALQALTTAVRRLAHAEDGAVLGALVGAGRTDVDIDSAAGIAARLTSMSQRLRGKGYLAPLAAIYSLGAGAERVPPPVLGEAEPLRRLFAGGIHEVDNLPAGIVALVLDTGAGSARVLVGQNYDLRWLGQSSEGHAFRLSVGVAAVVDNPEAVQVWRL